MSSEIPGRERMMHTSERVYEFLLLAYPEEFRDAYGPQMVQAFGDLCRDELRRGGVWGCIKLWARTVLELAVTVSKERSIVTMRSPGLAVLLSLLLPGLGQLYNRQVIKGLPWVLGGVAYLVFVASLGHPGLADGVVGIVYTTAILILLPAQVWSMFDAYESARRTRTATGR